jgi:multimeric flavodoxin WrbA
MKVLAINGSPRKNGNTSILIDAALEPLRKIHAECEVISLSGMRIRGCIACLGCRNNNDPDNPRCTQEDKDDFRGMIPRFLGADAIILGTPVYFGSAVPELMALLHRAGYAIRATQKPLLRGKIGAAVAVARRAGQNFTLAQLNYFFLINGMTVPGSTYWNMAFGGAPGEVKNDAEGIATMRALGENIAELLTKLKR